MLEGHLVQNAPEREEYADALLRLEPVLKGLPRKIVSIDGLPGVGKTTFARFLSWRFNTSMIETDLYLIPNLGRYLYRYEDLEKTITQRLNRNLPIIIEGIVCLDLLEECGLRTDFHIHIICRDALTRPSADYLNYVNTHKPDENSNLILNLPALI